MATVRRRKWTSKKGQRKEAWVVSYSDRDGDRHIRTFDRKRGADDFAASVHVDVGQGVHTAPSKSLTVFEAAELWIATGEEPGFGTH